MHLLLRSTCFGAQGSRKMSFKEFENALELLAADKGVSGEDLREKIAASSGPMCNATQAASVRLHDDRSTYTGYTCSLWIAAMHCCHAVQLP